MTQEIMRRYSDDSRVWIMLKTGKERGDYGKAFTIRIRADNKI